MCQGFAAGLKLVISRGLSNLREGLRTLKILRPMAKTRMVKTPTAKAYISALPNEVLVEVFTELKDNNLIETWHTITSVCRHWRAVALEAASLWTRPPTAHHDYTLLMLERSRNSLLEISLGSWTAKATSMEVLQHIQRISTLDISDQPDKALNDFQNTLLKLGHKASHLRSLHIQDLSSRPFRLSATTFLEPSSLKSVRLVAIDVDWELFPIRSLTSLSLERLRMVNGPSWIQFLHALRGMPLLEDLSFSFHSLRLDSPPIRSESLQMPSLRKLKISPSRPSVIRSFLLSTTFPRLQDVRINCITPANNLEDYSAIVNATLTLITRGDFGRFDHAEFETTRFMMSQISPVDWKSRRTLEFTCPHPEPGVLAQNAMTGISALPGNPVTDLVHVVCHTKLSSESFVDLFGWLPQLESLRSYLWSEVIESLKISPSHSPDLPAPFPSLQKLTLDNGDTRSYSSSTSFLAKELYNSLMTRFKRGFGIRELCINSELTTEATQLLQESVSDLDFWRIPPPA